VILVAHSFCLRRDRKQFERSKPYAPLATLLAAAILRDRNHSVAFFDSTFQVCADGFGPRLAALNPEIVLLIEDNFNYLTKMCTEDRRADALRMVAAARSAGARVAVNGPDASDNPRLYLEAGADAVMTGEGELGAAAIVAAFQGGEPLEKVPGLILLDAGALRYTRPRPQEQALDALPFPAWDLVDIPAYRETWMRAHGHFSWNMAASRGCPYSCNWCAKPTFGRRYAQRSAASVAEEMARLKREVAPDHIWFADDIFGMTEDWIAAFAEEVLRRDARVPFMMQSRTNLITEPVAAALAAAGAAEVWLGVESGSQRILDAMDKGTRIESVRAATRTLRRHGIRSGWFLQLGYPPEDWQDILLTRDLLRDERPDEIGVSVSYPLPGTVFHDRVVAELGTRRNWRDTDELAMLFQGAFDTAFYRMVRDALHADVDAGIVDELRWHDLARQADAHRSSDPVRMELRA
jgi:anaerobic magnesium-protoporphyrin IX monomethyl ester cyclase